MKEVIVTGPHKAEVRDVPMPKIENKHDVLIKMQSAGVCGSDHHIYHGTNPCSTYPRIPGHENAGIVTAVGSAVTTVKTGDHVIVDLIMTCGECYQCKIGRKNVCESVRVRGSGADDVVFILGTGTIGSIILQTCKAKGCKTVICCDVSDSSLERAKKYGADYVINSKRENLLERIQTITKGRGVTIAFDSACFKGSLTLVMQPGIVCNAGRIVPMGFVTEPESITQAMINQREIDIIGSRMSCCQFEPTIKHIENGDFDLEGIATNFIKFSNIQEVFYHMEHPDPSVKKMVILFDE
ncbi:zinc-dependent alcohol dehydrogenase [Pectinatus haikarae]|uniref:L-gulonate 5-dehydrogenase n=1 Tax=Pectinatus haikarae TaxID=349096 RepID=A0ABT9Y9V7_9FIRM|nr:alcohol dehydrogenase catalytic domain-containing protein [Pectinatus haikarae]MDQ0203982.1 L-gulonate 5-dehydrogenase [Pectinatus haikarae]